MTSQQADTAGAGARLAAELRRLREKAGLSFAELGERTPYSRSAWQRYLAAKVLPPWSAVRDLCRLAGETEPRLRALWELAESASRARGAVMAETPEPQPEVKGEPEPGPRSVTAREGRPRVYAVTAAIAALALAATGAYLLRGTGGTGDTSGTSHRSVAGPFTVTCTSGSCDPTCRGAACTGQDVQVTLCGVRGVPVIEQETPSGIDVDVHYNPRCQSAWARFWNTHVGDTLTLTAPGQPAQAVRVADPREEDTFTYTPLVFAAGSGGALKVCIRSGSGTPDCFTASTAS